MSKIVIIFSEAGISCLKCYGVMGPLAGPRDVEQVKPFISLHPSECCVVLDQSEIIYVLIFEKFSTDIDHIL